MKCWYCFMMVCLCPLAQANPACLEHFRQGDYVHISRIDLNCPEVKLVASQPQDQGLTVSEFAAKYQTVVAINGSFFRKDGSPIGLNMANHRPWHRAQDTRSRSFLACTARNQCSIDPLDHFAKANAKWAFAVAGWHYYHQQIGKFACAKRDTIGCSQAIFTDKHPRTMVGLDQKRNWLYLVVVEGRQLMFRGMTLDELAALAKALELTTALNLDGGGSSTMVHHQTRISALPILQGRERNVANHLGVKWLAPK